MSRSSTPALVRSELRKIVSTQLWWGLLIGGVAFTTLYAGITAGFAGMEAGPGQPATPGLESSQGIRGVYTVSAFMGMYIFALLLGITGMTSEYRYQTITPTFLVTPRRGHVVVAKMLAHLGMGLLFGMVAILTALTAGAVVIALRGYELGLGADRLWPSAGLAVLAVAIWTLLGIGIGTLIRNQIVAILLVILVAFLIEPLVTIAFGALDLGVVGKYLPTNASSALMQPGDSFVQYLDWWAGGLVLLAYAVVLAGLGMFLSVRRDVS